MCHYLTKFAPRTLADVLGQPAATAALSAFAAAPYPSAFLLMGPTGVGKTAAARALAADLGVMVSEEEYGGLHTIASGEQTGESVRQALAALRCYPFFGSGWRVLVVNECDRMSDAAAFIWLDALENLPARSVIAFTTNDPAKIPARLRDRCERVEFTGDALTLRPAAQALLAKLWADEQPGQPVPNLSAFKGLVENGQLSFRRLIQLATPFLRSGTRPDEPASPVQKEAFAPAPRPAPKKPTPAPARPAPDPAADERLKRQRDEIIARLNDRQPVGV